MVVGIRSGKLHSVQGRVQGRVQRQVQERTLAPPASDTIIERLKADQWRGVQAVAMALAHKSQ